MDPATEVPIFQDVKKIVWGNQINPDLFRRWSQGFTFSGDEPTALIQREGGPCGVIAPVQAFLLKSLLSDSNALKDNHWRTLKPEEVDRYLIQALTDILFLTATANTNDSNPPSTSTASPSKLQQAKAYNPLAGGTAASPPVSSPNMNEVVVSNENNDVQHQQPASQQPQQYCLVFLSEPLVKTGSDSESEGNLPSMGNAVDRRPQRSEEEIFHRNLRVLYLENIKHVQQVLTEKIEVLKGNQYGVLLFLYSVILTKGIENLKNEMSEPTEECTELIDAVHGHGSQSLINLMLCGKGVSHVWDGNQDVGGLNMKGIVQQCEVGFLSLLERLRYLEVGSFLKSPRFPIWVLASETHLTVLFSLDMKLVSPETQSEAARRVFHSYDPEGNNFISSVLLEDVMRGLELYSETEYVELMKKKLDPETLGIILLNDFMDEFFPNEVSQAPDTFILYHYNGLARSSSVQKVIYQEGNAILLESDMRCFSESNQILTCLQTKWPSIDIRWNGNNSPSIH